MAGRAKSMSRATLEQCMAVLAATDIPTVDITGGAPELNPNFRWLVERCLRDLGREAGLAALSAMNRYDGADFRWNALRPGLDAWLAELDAAGFKTIQMDPEVAARWTRKAHQIVWDRFEVRSPDSAAELKPLFFPEGVAAD